MNVSWIGSIPHLILDRDIHSGYCYCCCCCCCCSSSLKMVTELLGFYNVLIENVNQRQMSPKLTINQCEIFTNIRQCATCKKYLQHNLHIGHRPPSAAAANPDPYMVSRDLGAPTDPVTCIFATKIFAKFAIFWISMQFGGQFDCDVTWPSLSYLYNTNSELAAKMAAKMAAKCRFIICIRHVDTCSIIHRNLHIWLENNNN